MLLISGGKNRLGCPIKYILRLQRMRRDFPFLESCQPKSDIKVNHHLRFMILLTILLLLTILTKNSALSMSYFRTSSSKLFLPIDPDVYITSKILLRNYCQDTIYLFSVCIKLICHQSPIILHADDGKPTLKNNLEISKYSIMGCDNSKSAAVAETTTEQPVK